MWLHSSRSARLLHQCTFLINQLWKRQDMQKLHRGEVVFYENRMFIKFFCNLWVVFFLKKNLIRILAVSLLICIQIINIISCRVIHDRIMFSRFYFVWCLKLTKNKQLLKNVSLVLRIKWINQICIFFDTFKKFYLKFVTVFEGLTNKFLRTQLTKLYRVSDRMFW